MLIERELKKILLSYLANNANFFNEIDDATWVNLGLWRWNNSRGFHSMSYNAAVRARLWVASK